MSVASFADPDATAASSPSPNGRAVATSCAEKRNERTRLYRSWGETWRYRATTP